MQFELLLRLIHIPVSLLLNQTETKPVFEEETSERPCADKFGTLIAKRSAHASRYVTRTWNGHILQRQVFLCDTPVFAKSSGLGCSKEVDSSIQRIAWFVFLKLIHCGIALSSFRTTATSCWAKFVSSQQVVWNLCVMKKGQIDLNFQYRIVCTALALVTNPT